MLRRTVRPWLSEFGNTFGGRDPVSVVKQLEAVIEQVPQCTGSPWYSEIGDTLEALIERDWRPTLEDEIEQN